MRWLRRWGGYVLFAVGVVLAWVFLRKAAKPSLGALGNELQARKAEAEAEKVIVKKGVGEALKAVEIQHAEALKALTNEEKVQAEALKKEPVQLARFLVNAGRKGGALLFAFAIVCASAAPSVAQVTCDPDVPGACAAPIARGQPSPFDGQVVTTTLAISLGQKAAHCDTRIQIELTAARAVYSVEHKAAERIAAVDLRTARHEADTWKTVAQRQWWEHPLVLPAAVLVTAVGAAAATAYALKD